MLSFEEKLAVFTAELSAMPRSMSLNAQFGPLNFPSNEFRFASAHVAPHAPQSRPSAGASLHPMSNRASDASTLLPSLLKFFRPSFSSSSIIRWPMRSFSASLAILMST